jgi:hypothetical protein
MWISGNSTVEESNGSARSKCRQVPRQCNMGGFNRESGDDSFAKRGFPDLLLREDSCMFLQLSHGIHPY